MISFRKMVLPLLGLVCLGTIIVLFSEFLQRLRSSPRTLAW